MNIFQTYYKSPIGVIRIVGNQKGISCLEFVKRKGKSDKELPQPLKTCLLELHEYFSGRRQTFRVPLKPEGTSFQQRVWRALRRIPFGKTVSYGEIARQLKKPRAARAVGMANKKNRIPIMIPCHRVVGHDGSLTGYASGVWRKKWLLEHEC